METDAPAAVFVSDTHPDDFFTVLVSVIDNDSEEPSILAIDYTAETTDCEAALRITSGYAKPSGVIQKWINKKTARYLNKKKTARMFRLNRLQLPAAGTNRRYPFLPEKHF